MKYYTLFFVLYMASASAQVNCTNAYSSASYALAHAKKSLSSNNFDHQKYYAERALTAFEKTEKLASDCGCEGSRTPIQKGMDNLTKAIDPKDWEMGRYYTKKAVANAQDVLMNLDLCTSGEGTQRIEETYAVHTETDEDMKNPEELKAQLDLKRITELTLFEFEKSVKELATILGCEKAINLLDNKEFRTEAELNAEPLEATRRYYLKQTVALQKQALEALTECSEAGASQALMESKP